jgi:hypothetical protein
VDTILVDPVQFQDTQVTEPLAHPLLIAFPLDELDRIGTLLQTRSA